MAAVLRLAALLALLLGTLGVAGLSPHHRSPMLRSRRGEVHLPRGHPRDLHHHRTKEQEARWEHLKDTWIKKPPKLTDNEIRDLVRVLTKRNVPVKPAFKQAVRRIMSEATHNDDWESAKKSLKAHPEYFGVNKPHYPRDLKVNAKAAMHHTLAHQNKHQSHRRHHRHTSQEDARDEEEFERGFGSKIETFERQWRRHSKHPKHNWFSMSKALPEDDE